MWSKKITKILSVTGQALLIAFSIIFIVCPLSCCVSAEGIKIISGEADSPKLNGFTIIDDKHMQITFSENVLLKDVSIFEKSYLENKELNNFNIHSPDKINEKDSGELCDSGIDTSMSIFSSLSPVDSEGNYLIEFKNSTEIGNSYIVRGVVEDKNGNTLMFSLPFVGYNKDLPAVIITEVQPEYGVASKKQNTYRCEYIRFKALESGNLFGLVVGSATNGVENDFYFPAIEVAEGEDFIVHFRKKGEGCISELGNDLSVATAPHSRAGIRDFWLDNTGSAFSDDYDVIYLKDNINDRYIDGFMYINTKNKSKWSEKIEEKINEMVECGIFNSSSIEAACEEGPVTPKKTFVRINIPETISKRNKTIEIEDKTFKSNFEIEKFSNKNWIIETKN